MRLSGLKKIEFVVTVTTSHCTVMRSTSKIEELKPSEDLDINTKIHQSFKNWNLKSILINIQR